MKKNEGRIPGTEPVSSLVYLLKGEKISLEYALMGASDVDIVDRLLGALHLVESMLNLPYLRWDSRSYDVYWLVKQLKMDIHYQRELNKRYDVSEKKAKEELRSLKASLTSLKEQYTVYEDDDAFEAEDLRGVISVMKTERIPEAEVHLAAAESYVSDGRQKIIAMRALQGYLQDTKYFARLYEKKEGE